MLESVKIAYNTCTSWKREEVHGSLHSWVLLVYCVDASVDFVNHSVGGIPISLLTGSAISPSAGLDGWDGEAQYISVRRIFLQVCNTFLVLEEESKTVS
jgi:hypothetical protein